MNCECGRELQPTMYNFSLCPCGLLYREVAGVWVPLKVDDILNQVKVTLGPVLEGFKAAIDGAMPIINEIMESMPWQARWSFKVTRVLKVALDKADDRYSSVSLWCRSVVADLDQGIYNHWVTPWLAGDNANDVFCHRCRKWIREDPEHPGYADVHECVEAMVPYGAVGHGTSTGVAHPSEMSLTDRFQAGDPLSKAHQRLRLVSDGVEGGTVSGDFGQRDAESED
jgi:hypothetical protein